MRTGIGIGIQGSAPRASDPPVQAFQGKASGAGAESDLDILIDMSEATARLNSDGNYYTITVPDDFIGTRGSSDDKFLAARSTSASAIDLPAKANLNVILNIPVGMKVGANTANNININEANRSDPAIYLNLQTSEWTDDILTRLHITVNNYGLLIGSGGSGGWGGVLATGSKSIIYLPQGGGGGGQGLHPNHGSTDVTSYRDPNDSGILPAGQAGSGFGRWMGGLNGYGVNGLQGTHDAGGLAGAQGPDAGYTPNQRGAAGSSGGHIIYYVSNVTTSTTGTHINIHNNGWMSAGCGGGAGDQTGATSGRGGDWTLIPFGGDDLKFRGMGYPGNQLTGGGTVEFGGYPGRIIANTSNPNLIVSNTIVNNSGNTIYGWYSVIP